MSDHVTDALSYVIGAHRVQEAEDFDRYLLGDTGSELPARVPWWRTRAAEAFERLAWWAASMAERCDGRRLLDY